MGELTLTPQSYRYWVAEGFFYLKVHGIFNPLKTELHFELFQGLFSKILGKTAEVTNDACRKEHISEDSFLFLLAIISFLGPLYFFCLESQNELLRALQHLFKTYNLLDQMLLFIVLLVVLDLKLFLFVNDFCEGFLFNLKNFGGYLKGFFGFFQLNLLGFYNLKTLIRSQNGPNPDAEIACCLGSGEDFFLFKKRIFNDFIEFFYFFRRNCLYFIFSVIFDLFDEFFFKKRLFPILPKVLILLKSIQRNSHPRNILIHL